jgi:hypothetical protein
MALTVKELENAKPKAKKYKMLDGGGLSLLVLPTETKLWLWRYQFNAGEKNMTFGEYALYGPLSDLRSYPSDRSRSGLNGRRKTLRLDQCVETGLR